MNVYLGGMNMELFDKIGNRISSAGQEVTTQTKNLTEVARLNSEISNNEKAITELYFAIGKAVYEENIENEECSVFTYIAQISDLKSKNENIKNVVNELKGVVTCKNCGNKVSNKGAFCNYCGTPIERPVVQNRGGNVCTKCGAAVEQGDGFCFKCGQKVEIAVSSEADANVVENTCPSCAAVLLPGTKFCNKCGTRVIG